MGLNEIIKIGDNIKFYRQNKFLTQSDIAKELGIPRSTYANYENNTREPDKDVLDKIGKFLGISISELLEGPKTLNYEILELLQDKRIDINTLSKEVKLNIDEIKKCLTNVKAFFVDDLFKIGLNVGLNLEYLKRHIKYDSSRLHVKQNFEDVNTILSEKFNDWIINSNKDRIRTAIENDVKNTLNVDENDKVQYEIKMNELFEKYFYNLFNWKTIKMDSYDFFKFILSISTIDDIDILTSSDIDELAILFYRFTKLKGIERHSINSLNQSIPGYSERYESMFFLTNKDAEKSKNGKL